MPKVEKSFIKVNTQVSIHYNKKPRKGFWPTHISLKGTHSGGIILCWVAAMHASTASAPHILYRILQHSFSAASLHTLPTTVNSFYCIVGFGTAKRHRLMAASTSPGK